MERQFPDSVRSPELRDCIELLVDSGGVTRYDLPGVLDLLRAGSTGLGARARRLLHVTAEYGKAGRAPLLLDPGADVNARAGWVRMVCRADTGLPLSAFW